MKVAPYGRAMHRIAYAHSLEAAGRPRLGVGDRCSGQSSEKMFMRERSIAVKKGAGQSNVWKRMGGAVLVLLFLVTTVYADGGGIPGSADDPIVTKSYVDERVANLKKELGGGSVVPPSPGSGNQSGDSGGNTGTVGKGALKVEKLVAGQKVIAAEGTELIVRSGSVKVIAGEKGDGIPDVTSGMDLKGGGAVPANHLLLIPRSDGRGLHVVSPGSDGYSYIMIRGTYSVTLPPGK